MTLAPDGATLEFHWADEGQPDSVPLTLADFSEAVAAWLSALEPMPARV